MEDTFEESLVRQGQALGTAEQCALRQSSRMAGFFQIFGQLQRGGRVGVKKIRLELFESLQVFRQPFRREMIGREHEPVARGVVGNNPSLRLRTGDVTANDREARPVKIAGAPPHSLEKGLLLRAADALL